MELADPGLIDELLVAGAGLGPDASRAELDALAGRVVSLAATIDPVAAAAAVPANDPRHVIALHDSGALLALRRYAADEVSTVHAHPWTILTALEGEGILERWTPDATWSHAERTGARPVVIGENEPHRQRTATGALELVLLRNYGDDYARVELAPSPDELARADFHDAFIRAWSHADAAGFRRLLADDVFADVHVPHWRVQVAGADKLAHFVAAEEFRTGYRLADWSSTRTADGFVCETVAWFAHGPGEGHSEMCHVFRTAKPAGPITQHRCYCTGIWDDRTREGLRQSGGLLRP